MLDWLYYILLLLASALGLLLTILGLPGLWLIVVLHAGYGLLTGWDVYVGAASLWWLLGLAVLAEIVEFVAGAAGSKSAGGRTRGMVGAIVGALIGGIVGTFIPIPIVATIIGACGGAFVGATAMEMTDREWDQAMRVGIGAAKGRLYGIVVKLGIGAVMWLVVLVAAIPIRSSATAPQAPSTTLPATTPATTLAE